MAKKEHRQEQAIAALINSGSISEAAEQAGVGERTLFSWLTEPEFKEQYRQARREVVSQAMANLQQVCSLAVSTLADIMKDSEASPSSRVTAAKAALELAIRSVETEDILHRLEQLEEATNNGHSKTY